MKDDNYDLFGGTPPHSDDDTSLEAAEAVRATVMRKRARVKEYIVVRGAMGATDDEVEVALGFPHQSASARRRELVLLGMVKDSGVRRKTRNGRWAKVWVVGGGALGVQLHGARRVEGMPEVAVLRRAVISARTLYRIGRHSGGVPFMTDFAQVFMWLKGLDGGGAR